MSQLKELTEQIVAFRSNRDWKMFHDSKDMTISLLLEAAELLEHFQWKNGRELQKYLRTAKREVADEVVDVFYWVLLIAHDLEIDLVDALRRKMAQNAEKYPIKKAKGKSTKYKDL